MTYLFSRRFFLRGFGVFLSLLCIPFFAHAGVFSVIAGMFGDGPAVTRNVSVENAQTAPLLQAATHIDPNPAKGGGNIAVAEGALVPEAGPSGASGTLVLPSNGEISVYVVREGDSLSQIAEMFGVTANTILWANDIKSANLIKPGDSLIILPISGIRHLVKKGETIVGLARTYSGNVEDILAYNGLASVDDIHVGQTIVIPGGSVPTPPAPKKTLAKGATRTSKSSPASAGWLINPVPGATKTQGMHGFNGIDLGAPTGTNIRAAAAGDVIISKSTGWNGGYGSYIVIRHANGAQTLYAHNSANYVVAGQSVSQGESIGAVGSTGQSTGPHLHFEVRGATNPF